MKRYIITALCAFVACWAWGQLNAPCFTIPVPAGTPTYYTLHTIEEDSTVIALDNAPIYALAVTGHAYLQSPSNSMARIILVDNYGNEHLVFETNSLLSDTSVVAFENAGRETLWEDMIYASHLIVRLRNASVEMNTPVLITQLLEESTPAIKQARAKAQCDTIVNVLNRNLIANDIPWRAGNTNITEMEYNERRMILGDNNPFDNIEYYIGGYYVAPAFDVAQTPAVDDDYVDEFDWRNRHGKNWITPAKQQWRSDCWAFASIANAESYINLYYNDAINIDLSEQQLDSVVPYSTFAKGGHIEEAHNYMTKNELLTENCFPYRYIGVADTVNGFDQNYVYTIKCENPDTIFRFCSYYKSDRFNDYSDLKKELIKQPIAISINRWRHAVECIGYKNLIEGDTAYYYTKYSHTYHPDSLYKWNKENYIVISETCPYKNCTALVLKNSWWWYRTIYGDWPMIDSIGVRYMILPLELVNYVVGFSGEIYSEPFTNSNIICSDADNDGYYFWGIGDKPAHCPAWASDIADGDDSNPMYGAMNEYGYLEEIGPDYTESLVINTDDTWSQPRAVSGDIIIPSGVTLTITSYLTMHPEAQILIQGGKLILDGGTIRNGDIRNNGNLTILNNGIVEMCGSDQYRHKPSELDVINNGNTPFPATTNIQQGAFMRVNR